MGRIFGFVGVLAAVAVSTYLYSRQASIIGVTNAAAPSATLSVIGIQNNLLAMANAERSHFALEGKYVLIDELMSSGDMRNQGRPCSYDSSVSEAGFRITATCSGRAAPGTSSVFSIDETMQIHSD